MCTSRSGGITIVDLLVIVTVIAVLMVMCIPATGPPPPLTDEDLKFDAWHPEAEKASEPPKNTLAPDVVIAGNWTSLRRRRTCFSIEPAGPVQWQVTFHSSSGCGLGKSILLSRTATYDNGVLLLNRPVQELSGKTYQRLYSVRINEQEYLVPSVRVKLLQQILTQGSGEQLSESLELEMLFRIE